MPFVIQLQAKGSNERFPTYISKRYIDGYPVPFPGQPGQKPMFWKTAIGAKGALIKRAPVMAIARGFQTAGATVHDWLNFAGKCEFECDVIEVDKDFVIPGEVQPKLKEMQATKLIYRLKADIARLENQKRKIERQLETKRGLLSQTEEALRVERERQTFIIGDVIEECNISECISA